MQRTEGRHDERVMTVIFQTRLKGRDRVPGVPPADKRIYSAMFRLARGG
jgi:hypothetical protein